MITLRLTHYTEHDIKELRGVLEKALSGFSNGRCGIVDGCRDCLHKKVCEDIHRALCFINTKERKGIEAE